jgi:hypothetical protein
MTSIAGERAEELAEVTLNRRSARAEEIISWAASVSSGDWHGTGYRSPSAWIAAATGEPFGACQANAAPR